MLRRIKELMIQEVKNNCRKRIWGNPSHKSERIIVGRTWAHSTLKLSLSRGLNFKNNL